MYSGSKWAQIPKACVRDAAGKERERERERGRGCKRRDGEFACVADEAAVLRSVFGCEILICVHVVNRHAFSSLRGTRRTEEGKGTGD